MAGAGPNLTKQYRIEDAAGVGQFLAVVCGANDGGCKKPTGANAAGFLGVTREAQPNQNKGVPVDKAGIVRVKFGGTIARGDRLAINGNTGDVKSVEAQITAAPGTAAVVNVIGMAEISGVAGDLGLMFIAPSLVNIAAS
ncbi:MAG TPA: hypothetical protein VG273_11830 [Bryobacteraceae bacterium]|nr:hypothetical protein [Bryobacteraceae bacterium]